MQKRWTVRDRGPRPVDAHVGSRVRLRRTMLGLSQEKLGDEIGLTFQQVQKYERGTNRIGASRLYELSRVLDVPVSYFFEDMVRETSGGQSARSPDAEIVKGPSYEAKALSKRETLELVRAYYNIKDEKLRKRLFDLVKAAAKSD